MKYTVWRFQKTSDLWRNEVYKRDWVYQHLKSVNRKRRDIYQHIDIQSTTQYGGHDNKNISTDKSILLSEKADSKESTNACLHLVTYFWLFVTSYMPYHCTASQDCLTLFTPRSQHCRIAFPKSLKLKLLCFAGCTKPFFQTRKWVYQDTLDMTSRQGVFKFNISPQNKWTCFNPSTILPMKESKWLVRCSTKKVERLYKKAGAPKKSLMYGAEAIKAWRRVLEN